MSGHQGLILEPGQGARHHGENLVSLLMEPGQAQPGETTWDLPPVDSSRTR